MVFMYLSFGILAVLILHSLLSFFTEATPATIRHTARFVWYGALLVAIVLLIRFGLPHIAAIVSFTSVALPIWERFQRFRPRQPQRPHHPAPPSQQMSDEEARDILGVDVNATPEEIHDAHKRLIRKLHPDQGGSDYLAAQINKARDVLLRKK